MVAFDSAEFPSQLARTGRFTYGAPRAFTVSPDGERVLFLRSRAGDDPVCCLWMYQDGTEHLLADPAELDAGDAELPPEELTRRERARERAVGIVGYATDAAVRTVAFALGGRLWTVDTAHGTPRPVRTVGPLVDPRPDPTGARIAYVCGGAMYVVELDGGTNRMLARSEGPHIGYGLAEHAAAESMGRSRGYWWAPDGSRLLVARVDESAVQRWWISDPAHPDRAPRSMAYPVAGTANAEVTLHIVDLAGGRTEVAWDRAAFEYVAAAVWDAHGPLVTVQSRDQRTVRVLEVDPETGATALAHEQRDPAWVQLVPGTPARTASGRLVRADERDDTRRLSIGDGAVTPPGRQLREVLGVSGERVLFTASEEPTEVHVWSRDPEEGLTRLSTEPGVHTAALGGRTVVLDSRTADGRAFTVLRDGQPVGTVASFAERPVVTPRISWLRTGERGIRTALLLPSWYAPGTRLPVLLCPYAGHGMQLAVATRDWWLCEAQWFAEAGFAVVVADGRGTPGRGPRWEKAFHGDKLSAALEDQVTAVLGAAEHCRDLDLTRTAIRGWSYGGYLAAAAVLRRPDVFHAAVAGAAPFDQRLYDTHWQERFLGHPDEQPENYDRCSLIADAPRLRRPLLLVHGLADDNVTAAHTLRMSAALLAAGRPHTVLPLSGVSHAVLGARAVERLLLFQRDFLRDALGRTDGAGR
ncbi:prolyl oligopeptidase family serine peptidase [Streptomyces silvisoli]|uniref:Prolyl oligopeptidase family serine peptidase n=1 Tax=Streptomyces silvisoli TaxID=3034235 RepID=A0ABT5ZPD2_9ACTN|nr:prolyl oligopeptidase family serine peptidase [Streptomyces silvisoli]MDF3291693.1 prolyl oligopeptidase family serine peptidase [Streptomyces silvisoli]